MGGMQGNRQSVLARRKHANRTKPHSDRRNVHKGKQIDSHQIKQAWKAGHVANNQKEGKPYLPKGSRQVQIKPTGQKHVTLRDLAFEKK